MIKVHPEFVVDKKNQRKTVVLPADEWEEIMDQLEELDDIRAYDAAKKGDSEKIPFEQAVREIQEEYGK